MIGARDFIEFGVGQLAVDAVDKGAEFAGVDEERLLITPLMSSRQNGVSRGGAEGAEMFLEFRFIDVTANKFGAASFCEDPSRLGQLLPTLPPLAIARSAGQDLPHVSRRGRVSGKTLCRVYHPAKGRNRCPDARRGAGKLAGRLVPDHQTRHRCAVGPPEGPMIVAVS